MALTARTPAQEGFKPVNRSTKLPGGLLLVSAAGIVLGTPAGTDYGANGILLSAIAPLVGLRSIYAVLALSIRASGGTIKVFQFLHDYNTATIRLYKGASVEITAASDLAVGDIMKLTLVGV